MGKEIRQLFESNVWLRILTIVVVCLLIAGFILPPLAHIDGSVLTACGELAGLGVLWLVYYGVEKGVDVTAKHHDTEISVTGPNSEKDSVDTTFNQGFRHRNDF